VAAKRGLLFHSYPSSSFSPRFFWQFKDKFEFIIAENRFTWYIHRKNPTQKVGRLRERAAVFLWKSFGEF